MHLAGPTKDVCVNMGPEACKPGMVSYTYVLQHSCAFLEQNTTTEAVHSAHDLAYMPLSETSYVHCSSYR